MCTSNKTFTGFDQYKYWTWMNRIKYTHTHKHNHDVDKYGVNKKKISKIQANTTPTTGIEVYLESKKKTNLPRNRQSSSTVTDSAETVTLNRYSV